MMGDSGEENGQSNGHDNDGGAPPKRPEDDLDAHEEMQAHPEDPVDSLFRALQSAREKSHTQAAKKLGQEGSEIETTGNFDIAGANFPKKTVGIFLVVCAFLAVSTWGLLNYLEIRRFQTSGSDKPRRIETVKEANQEAKPATDTRASAPPKRPRANLIPSRPKVTPPPPRREARQKPKPKRARRDRKLREGLQENNNPLDPPANPLEDFDGLTLDEQIELEQREEEEARLETELAEEEEEYDEELDDYDGEEDPEDEEDY